MSWHTDVTHEPEFQENSEEVMDFNSLTWGYHQRRKWERWHTIKNEDGLLIAVGSLHGIFDGHTGLMCSDGVLPKYRGRGLQRKLIEARIGDARNFDIHRLVCQINRYSESGRASENNYKRFGFKLEIWQPPGVECDCNEYVLNLKD